MAGDAFDSLAEKLVRGSEHSYVAYLTERFLDMLDEAVTNPDRFQVLASRSKTAAMAAWDRFRGKVTEETRSAFMQAMRGEDELLVSSLAKAYGYDRTISTRGNNELNEAARGMAEIMRRQNVALADNLADEWYKVTSDAVTSTLMGGDYRTVMEDAVSRLSDAGLETIDYRSGVRTTIDAATRRHVVSQANQARADLALRRCEEWGCDLVMVSAHFGARPSHRLWQGQVYSRSGNDKRYPSLDEGTGYHGTGPFAALGDRLCGVHCSHKIFPYIEGYSQLPSTDFSEQERQVGMTSDEWYAAKQRQRGMERKVRSLKRKVALGQERGLDMTADRYRLGRAQAALREHCATTGLRRDYERERAYAVAKQPTGLGRVDFNPPKWKGQYPNPTSAPKAAGNALKFNSINDPVRDVAGPAEESNPDGLKRIVTSLSERGFEISRPSDRESLGYSPSLIPGTPGKVIVSEGASYSAWLHEEDHALFDESLGFPGLTKLLFDRDIRVEFERRAYEAEIRLCQKNGYDRSVIESLKRNLSEEIRRINGFFNDEN